MIAKKSTMTLNISPEEMERMEILAKKKNVSKTQLVRRALKLYEILDREASNDLAELYLKSSDKTVDIKLVL